MCKRTVDLSRDGDTSSQCVTEKLCNGDILCVSHKKAKKESLKTLYLLTCRIRRTPNNASNGQMRFNLAFKGLKNSCLLKSLKNIAYIQWKNDLFCMWVELNLCIIFTLISLLGFVLTFNACAHSAEDRWS